jgi:hypothetical protein
MDGLKAYDDAVRKKMDRPEEEVLGAPSLETLVDQDEDEAENIAPYEP